MTELDGRSAPIAIAPGGFQLLAAGLTGSIEETDEGNATRGRWAAVHPELDDALRRSDVTLVKAFEIDIESDLPPSPSSGTRSTAASAISSEGEPVMLLAIPDFDTPDEAAEYVVLDIDQAGGARWILPSGTRDGKTVEFHLPRTGGPLDGSEDGSTTTRGPGTKMFRRSFRVLSWLAKPVLSAGGTWLVRQYENRCRPYVWRRGEPSLPIHDWPAIEQPDWTKYGGGPTLVLVHGTFSVASEAFSGLQGAALTALFERYRGRVVAFDHPTLGESLRQNADAFLQRIPSSLRLDLLTHSRGGLVANELVRRAPEKQLSIGRTALIATPFGGTPLTEGKHMVSMLDRYTSLLTLLPDSLSLFALEGVLMVLKLAVHQLTESLPGLSCMRPAERDLATAGEGFPGKTFAMAADFKPTSTHPLLRCLAQGADKLVDGVFKDIPNDLVVPTQTAHELSALTLEDRFVAEGSAVHHGSFFANEKVQERLLAWLGG